MAFETKPNHSKEITTPPNHQRRFQNDPSEFFSKMHHPSQEDDDEEKSLLPATFHIPCLQEPLPPSAEDIVFQKLNFFFCLLLLTFG